MKYKEILILSCWPFRRNYKYCLYRFDSIPYTGKKKKKTFGCYYKKLKTTQEKKLWYRFPYGRRKRSPKNLPDQWDDYLRSDIKTRKSWKSKKIEKQWMKGYRPIR